MVTYTLAGLAPIDAARLLARRVGRPLHELLPPAEPRGSLASHALAALGGDGGGGGGGGRGPPSPVLPPTLEELAEEPLMTALRGRPALIVHAAAAISARAAGVSVRTAFEHAARAADADEARRTG